MKRLPEEADEIVKGCVVMVFHGLAVAGCLMGRGRSDAGL